MSKILVCDHPKNVLLSEIYRGGSSTLQSARTAAHYRHWGSSANFQIAGHSGISHLSMSGLAIMRQLNSKIGRAKRATITDPGKPVSSKAEMPLQLDHHFG